jgi:hypothetical protein
MGEGEIHWVHSEGARDASTPCRPLSHSATHQCSATPSATHQCSATHPLSHPSPFSHSATHQCSATHPLSRPSPFSHAPRVMKLPSKTFAPLMIWTKTQKDKSDNLLLHFQFLFFPKDYTVSYTVL